MLRHAAAQLLFLIPQDGNGRPPPSVKIEMCSLSRSSERMLSEMVSEANPGRLCPAEIRSIERAASDAL